MLVAVVDYGMCNLDSVGRMLEVCGGKVVIAAKPSDFEYVTHIVLPGVGSFFEAMKQLKKNQLDEAISKVVTEEDIPILGICLGMQLLTSFGDEGGGVEGLGLIPGRVQELLPKSTAERVPHIGWNELRQQKSHPIFDGVQDASDFYFVHSYHACVDESHVLATTPHCGGFSSAIGRGKILGVQFHPEKSQKVGRQMLSNFLKM